MKERRHIIVRILEWGTILSAFGLIFTVILQIITRRFFVDISLSWTEEVSRFFFVYTVSFGAGLAQKEGYNISMDYFYRKFNPRMKNILDLVVSIFSTILFLLMTVFSVYFIILGLVETSPSLGLPMSIAFGSMLIMSGTVLFFLLIELIHNIRTAGK